MGLRHHRTVRLAGVAITAFVAAVCTACTSSSPSAAPSDTSPRVTSTAPSTSTTTQPLTAARANALAHGLTSTNRHTAVTVLAPAAATAYRSHPSRFWPAGTTVTLDWHKLHVLSPVLATVPAVATGTAPGRWTLLLEDVHGSWSVLSTSKVRR